jgi:hypothetical protein
VSVLALGDAQGVAELFVVRYLLALRS